MLRERRKTAVTFGIVEYEDVFGTKHWTKFCMRLVINAAVSTGMPEVREWGLCKFGNEIDPN